MGLNSTTQPLLNRCDRCSEYVFTADGLAKLRDHGKTLEDLLYVLTVAKEAINDCLNLIEDRYRNPELEASSEQALRLITNSLQKFTTS